MHKEDSKIGRRRLAHIKLLLMLVIVCTLLSAGTAGAGTILVNSLADSDANDGICTLREAIVATNGDADYHGCTAASYGADTIVFNVFDASLRGTILMTADLPIVSDDLAIVGLGAGLLAVDGNNAYRLFQIDSNSGPLTPAIVTSISGLTITRGRGNTVAGGYGGGVRVDKNDELTLDGCVVTDNRAPTGGGVYVFQGTLHVFDTIIDGNTTIDAAWTASSGGGIWNGGGTVEIVGSTISNNTSGNFAGGIGNYANIGETATMTITNSTVSGNMAENSGGGIYSPASAAGKNLDLRIRNSTIVFNTADWTATRNGDGGGIWGHVAGMKNTMLAHNTDDLTGSSPSKPDCAATIVSEDYNLVQDASGCTISGGATHDITGTAPELGTLADNGGPTPTHALLRGSRGIDEGAPAGCEAADQRGVLRPQAGSLDFGAPRCDIGAFELQLPGTAAITVNTIADEYDFVGDGNDGGDCSLREAIKSAADNADFGGCGHTGTYYGPDIIVFAPGLTGNILLGSTLTAPADPLAIEGPGPAVISLDGQGTHRIFSVGAGRTLRVSGLGFRNGYDTGATGDASGGISVLGGELTLEDTAFEGNLSGGPGGALSVFNGIVTVANATFSDNHAPAGNGGAIYVSNSLVSIADTTFTGNGAAYGGAVAARGSDLSCRRCSFEGNSASQAGGALRVERIQGAAYAGRVELRDTVFRDNHADGANGNGGAVSLEGGAHGVFSGVTATGNTAVASGGAFSVTNVNATLPLSIVNSTISGNSAGTDGGGIDCYNGYLEMANLTIVDNTADADGNGEGAGGGVFGGFFGSIAMRNSIVANNHVLGPGGSPDCRAAISSGGFNLVTDETGCDWTGGSTGHIIGQDPGLGPLADLSYGSFFDPTPTHGPLMNSPAIDAGDPNGCTWDHDNNPATPEDPLRRDQRDRTRPVDGDGAGGPRCDIGAVEAAGQNYGLWIQVNGNGSVSSAPGEGIDCGPDCFQVFDSAVTWPGITLTATPDYPWVLGAWSGDCTPNGMTCVVDPNGDRSVTATFILDPNADSDGDGIPDSQDNCPANQPVRIGSWPTPSIQYAVDSSIFDSLLELQGESVFTFEENVDIANPHTFTLRGGYSCDFQTRTDSFSVIHGTVTVSSGTLQPDGIIIR